MHKSFILMNPTFSVFFSFFACVLDITYKNFIAKYKVMKICSYVFSKKFRTSGITLSSRGEITFFFF